MHTLPPPIWVAIGIVVLAFGLAIGYTLWTNRTGVKRFTRGRSVGPDYKSLYQLGYELKSSKPNKDGLCKHKIVCIATGEVVAQADTPSTFEQALTGALKYANENLIEAV